MPTESPVARSAPHTSADITDWLVQEARDVGDRINAWMLADERMLATAVTLLGAAASVAVAKGQLHLLMALPFALSILFCFVEYQHAHVMALGGYKSALERTIEHRVGAPIMAWEMSIAPALHRTWTVVSLRTLGATLYAASVCVALYEAFSTTVPGHWGHAHAAECIVLTVGTIALGTTASAVSLCVATRQFDSVAKKTHAALVAHWTDMGQECDPASPVSALTSASPNDSAPAIAPPGPGGL